MFAINFFNWLSKRIQQPAFLIPPNTKQHFGVMDIRLCSWYFKYDFLVWVYPNGSIFHNSRNPIAFSQHFWHASLLSLFATNFLTFEFVQLFLFIFKCLIEWFCKFFLYLTAIFMKQCFTFLNLKNVLAQAVLPLPSSYLRFVFLQELV